MKRRIIGAVFKREPAKLRMLRPVEISAPRRNLDEEKVESIALSIEANGFDESQPLGVTLIEHEGGLAVYSLIDGNHRLRAAERVGLEEVPCQVSRAEVRQGYIHFSPTLQPVEAPDEG